MPMRGATLNCQLGVALAIRSLAMKFADERVKAWQLLRELFKAVQALGPTKTRQQQNLFPLHSRITRHGNLASALPLSFKHTIKESIAHAASDHTPALQNVPDPEGDSGAHQKKSLALGCCCREAPRSDSGARDRGALCDVPQAKLVFEREDTWCVYIYIWICMYVCRYVCMHVCMLIFICKNAIHA